MPSIEERMKNAEKRIKRLEDQLELSANVQSFDWKDFSDRDKQNLEQLLSIGKEGATTTVLAVNQNYDKPETSGRVKVYRSLRHIERISRKLKGIPIVVCERKKWSLNYDDYQFNINRPITIMKPSEPIPEATVAPIEVTPENAIITEDTQTSTESFGETITEI